MRWKFQPQWANTSRFKTSGGTSHRVSHKETEKKVRQTLLPEWNISQTMQVLFTGNHLLFLEAMSRGLWWGWEVPPTIPICLSQMITLLLEATSPRSSQLQRAAPISILCTRASQPLPHFPIYSQRSPLVLPTFSAIYFPSLVATSSLTPKCGTWKRIGSCPL